MSNAPSNFEISCNGGKLWLPLDSKHVILACLEINGGGLTASQTAHAMADVHHLQQGGTVTRDCWGIRPVQEPAT